MWVHTITCISVYTPKWESRVRASRYPMSVHAPEIHSRSGQQSPGTLQQPPLMAWPHRKADMCTRAWGTSSCCLLPHKLLSLLLFLSPGLHICVLWCLAFSTFEMQDLFVWVHVSKVIFSFSHCCVISHGMKIDFYFCVCWMSVVQFLNTTRNEIIVHIFWWMWAYVLRCGICEHRAVVFLFSGQCQLCRSKFNI